MCNFNRSQEVTLVVFDNMFLDDATFVNWESHAKNQKQ